LKAKRFNVSGLIVDLPLYATDDQPVDGLVVANGSGTWGVSAAATSGNGGMEEWSHLPIIDGKVARA